MFVPAWQLFPCYDPLIPSFILLTKEIRGEERQIKRRQGDRVPGQIPGGSGIKNPLVVVFFLERS